MKIPYRAMNAAPASQQPSEAAVALQRVVRPLTASLSNPHGAQELYESEEIAYCECGEQINIVRGSSATCRNDKIRLRYPDDTEGWCVFRCRKCREVADPKHNAPATSPASNSSAWVEGKTHRGTDGETTARRRVIGGRVELEIKDGNGWLRCMGDGYFTPNVPAEPSGNYDSKQSGA